MKKFGVCILCKSIEYTSTLQLAFVKIQATMRRRGGGELIVKRLQLSLSEDCKLCEICVLTRALSAYSLVLLFCECVFVSRTSSGRILSSLYRTHHVLRQLNTTKQLLQKTNNWLFKRQIIKRASLNSSLIVLV